MGISFSGGLSIVAAGRPSLRGPRRLRVLARRPRRSAARAALSRAPAASRCRRPTCSSDAGDATRRSCVPPHDYGVAVILLSASPTASCPPAQVERLRDGVRQYPAGRRRSTAASTRRRRAGGVRGAARRWRGRCPSRRRRCCATSIDRDVVHLGARLLPLRRLVRRRRRRCRSSKSPKPSAPVFLLHGTRRQRHPGGRVRVSRRRSARPRAGAAAAERPHLARRSRSPDARRRRAAARGLLGRSAVALNQTHHEGTKVTKNTRSSRLDIRVFVSFVPS